MPSQKISIGSDIVEVDRIENLISKFGYSFHQKIFSNDEIIYCQKKIFPARSFAARFAAKEAFSKALGVGIGKYIAWKDISVGKNSEGNPFIILSNHGYEIMKKFGFSESKLSMSHTKTLAQAVVLLIN